MPEIMINKLDLGSQAQCANRWIELAVAQVHGVSTRRRGGEREEEVTDDITAELVDSTT
jgi:hypothetical protein